MLSEVYYFRSLLGLSSSAANKYFIFNVTFFPYQEIFYYHHSVIVSFMNRQKMSSLNLVTNTSLFASCHRIYFISIAWSYCGLH